MIYVSNLNFNSKPSREEQGDKLGYANMAAVLRVSIYINNFQFVYNKIYNLKKGYISYEREAMIYGINVNWYNFLIATPL